MHCIVFLIEAKELINRLEQLSCSHGWPLVCQLAIPSAEFRITSIDARFLFHNFIQQWAEINGLDQGICLQDKSVVVVEPVLMTHN